MRWHLECIYTGSQYIEVIQLEAVKADLAYERWSAIMTASELADSIDLRDSLRALAGPEPQRGERKVGGFSVYPVSHDGFHPSISWDRLCSSTTIMLLDAAAAFGLRDKMLQHLQRRHYTDRLERPTVHPDVDALLAELADED